MGWVQGGARAAFATPSWGPARKKRSWTVNRPFVKFV
jgi:hypothetical protein